MRVTLSPNTNCCCQKHCTKCNNYLSLPEQIIQIYNLAKIFMLMGVFVIPFFSFSVFETSHNLIFASLMSERIRFSQILSCQILNVFFWGWHNVPTRRWVALISKRCWLLITNTSRSVTTPPPSESWELLPVITKEEGMSNDLLVVAESIVHHQTNLLGQLNYGCLVLFCIAQIFLHDVYFLY